MPYTPREAAARTGFSMDTLRYYERIGLLDSGDRNSSGQRVFTDGDLAWLEILRCLRDTGMPIARMQRYAELASGGDETFAERAKLLEEHDAEIERKIEALRDEQARIRHKIEWYRQELAAVPWASIASA
ncbi:MerR family transcriptional regulator [Dactylosporangium salmoneum]|uniref:MerR family transcriptional regulator n=1 Tax=Dactylosporangium salmoneum TaxID=53361 RepID=A0ABP5UX40_9ACTN